MSQRWGENRYRNYPLAQTASVPFSNTLLVDLAVRLRGDFAFLGASTDQIALTQVAISGSTVTVRFDITTAAKSGYWLGGSFQLTDPEEIVVPLALHQDATATPSLGYGRLTVGVPGAAQTFNGSLAVDPSVVRELPDSTALQISVGNLNRPRASQYADGAATSLSPLNFHAWQLTTAAGNYQKTTSPDPNQNQVASTIDCAHGTELTSIPVPPAGVPVTTVTGYDATVTVQRSSLVLADTIGAQIAGRDGQLIGTTARQLIAGFNCELSGPITQGIVKIGYRLGAGRGMSDCANYPGYDVAELAGNCVRAINGQRGTDGLFTLLAGPGVQIAEDQANHALTVIFSPENLIRAAAP